MSVEMETAEQWSDVPLFTEAPVSATECPDCGRDFRTVGGMRRHRTVAHGVTETKPDKAPRSSRAASGSKSLKVDLENMLGGIASMVMIANPVDGAIVAAHAVPIAQAWANLAQKNEPVRRFLTSLTTGSAYGEVVFATLPLVLGLLANHGKLPAAIAPMFVVPTP